MDAGLAKVMNSTVGTSAVKALDTIIKESDTANVEKLNTYMTTIANNAADRLYNKLKADVRLVGSDEVLGKYDGTWEESNNRAAWTTKAVVFSHGGTVIAKTVQRSTDGHSLYVYKGANINTSLIGTATHSKVTDSYDIELSTSFNVEAGQVYCFKIESNGTTPRQNLEFCATPYSLSPTVTIS